MLRKLMVDNFSCKKQGFNSFPKAGMQGSSALETFKLK